MAERRTPVQLRAVRGDRKKGETAGRVARAVAPQADVDIPTEVPVTAAEAAEVWDRIAPRLQARGLLNDENTDLLWAYCLAVAANRGAAREMLDEDGSPMRDSQDRGRVKNPATGVFRDTAATMRQLAAMLHLDDLGLGVQPDGQDAERLLS